VSVFDHVMNEPVDLKADILALSVGAAPNPENAAIGQMLKVPTNQDGFFLEPTWSFAPWTSPRRRLYVRHVPRPQDERGDHRPGQCPVSRPAPSSRRIHRGRGKDAYVNKISAWPAGSARPTAPTGPSR